MNLRHCFKELKVIELANILAGPAVGMFFAELGAQVIKIENKKTGGDPTRQWKLPKEDKTKATSAYYHSVNWNKTSMFLDLSDQQDFQRLMEELETADVIISNFKAGSAQKLQLDYSSLKKRFPQLIYASISAYGENNPKPGFDVVIQAETGWLSMNGEEGRGPVKMPVALMDILAAHQLKEAILIALLNRLKNGVGCQVSVSLFDTGVASLANQATNWLNAQHLPQRMGSRHPNIAPYGEIFYTQDKQAVILAPGTEVQFRQLCHCLDRPEILAMDDFRSNALRLSNRDQLNKLLQPAFQRIRLQELLKRTEKRGVPVAPIRNLAQLFELPEAQALILEETLPDGSKSKRVKTAIFTTDEAPESST
ncbi:MAG: CoA transferase [Bacteroidota bacterium]